MCRSLFGGALLLSHPGTFVQLNRSASTKTFSVLVSRFTCVLVYEALSC